MLLSLGLFIHLLEAPLGASQSHIPPFSFMSSFPVSGSFPEACKQAQVSNILKLELPLALQNEVTLKESGALSP